MDFFLFKEDDTSGSQIIAVFLFYFKNIKALGNCLTMITFAHQGF